MASPAWLSKLRKVFKVGPIKTVQGRFDEIYKQTRDEIVSHARTEAERFLAEQIALIETKIDMKIAEIERKLDEQIEKELRAKLRILIYTLIAVILMSLISLGYFYMKKQLGL